MGLGPHFSRRLRSVLTPLAVVLASSCYVNPQLSDCNEIARTFFHAHWRDQEEAFRQLDFERQFRACSCGQHVMEPSINLSHAFAAQGAPAATFLSRKLADTPHDLEVLDAIALFVAMHDDGTFEITSDPQLLALARRRADAIGTPSWRSQAQAMLARIDSQKS